MDTIRRENEKTPALGNMGVNAKGDKITRGGTIARTADQIARDNHRVQSSVIHTGLKGSVTELPATQTDNVKTPAKSTVLAKKIKEKELPSGDIVVEDDNDQ